MRLYTTYTVHVNTVSDYEIDERFIHNGFLGPFGLLGLVYM